MLCVALHNFRSLYNVGSVFRTASGAGFERLYLSGYTGAPPDKRISKVALGAEEEIPFESVADIDALLETVSGHHVVLLEQHPDSVLYSEIEPDSSKPVTVVLGEELFGSPDEIVARADVIAEIPMAGEKESLNVASAFAIIAYDLAIKMGTIGADSLRSRHPSTPPRPGVLTNGPTLGESPGTSEM